MEITIKIKKKEFKALAESGLLSQLLQGNQKRQRGLYPEFPLSFYKGARGTSVSARQLIDFLKTQSELKGNESECLKGQDRP
ncbi:hypothetical protein [Elizabethkingia miricola]|uniref:hypothetical protein n=1 Tax=Elizabethkingia miricola TaxID=172045 RepID=UPI0009992209|nr:hypothetical protein [Elizabethkingia miricola]OPC36192.1 hypothetical protein BAX99_19235 [Elizabethkingia miricola]